MLSFNIDLLKVDLLASGASLFWPTKVYIPMIGRKHKNYSNPFRIRLFLFLSYLFGIETMKNVHTLPNFLRKPNLISDQNGQSVNPFSDQNDAKPYPMGRHISIWRIYGRGGGGAPPPPPRALKLGSEAWRFSPVFRGVSGVVALTVDGYFLTISTVDG